MLEFRERADARRRLLVGVRAYDDGVAFRYRIEGSAPVRLRGEKTAFVPAGDRACLVSVADAAHEVPFARHKVSRLGDGQGYDVPVVCTTPSGRTAYALTQSHLEGYTGASLWREGAGLRVHLSAVPGRAAPVYESHGGLQTAWRVVLLGNRTGDLIASNVVGNLNPAPQGDSGWVKPGKAAWDWWSGPLAGMKPDMAACRRCIDFAAASGFPYYLIDAGWALGSGGGCDALPATDVTRAADGIDMPALVRYAAEKGVGLILWAHWEHVRNRMDEELDTYARWGIKGVKTDFMNRDDQDVVDFYHRVPTAWDETRFLSGEPGKDIVLARRVGTTWYVGAMSADDGTTTKQVQLDFLPAGRYKATIWEDGATPNDVNVRGADVTARDALALRLAAAGGAAVVIEPR